MENFSLLPQIAGSEGNPGVEQIWVVRFPHPFVLQEKSPFSPFRLPDQIEQGQVTLGHGFGMVEKSKSHQTSFTAKNIVAQKRQGLR